MNLVTVLNGQNGVDRQEVTGFLSVLQHQHFAFRITQGDTRTQIAAAGLALPVHDNLTGQASILVDHVTQADAVDQITIGRGTGLFGDDRNGERIPFHHLLALLNCGTVLLGQARAIGQTVTGAFATVRVQQNQFRRAVHDHHTSL